MVMLGFQGRSLRGGWGVGAEYFGEMAIRQSTFYDPGFLLYSNKVQISRRVNMALGSLVSFLKQKRKRIGFNVPFVGKIYLKSNFVLFLDYWEDDIALIRLREPIPSGAIFNRIRRVQLPIQGNSSFPAVGNTCVMNGWGCTAGGNYFSNIFQHTVRQT